MGVLDGKAAVVTGSGRGIGRGYATFMAREGARVVVNDVDRDVAEKTAGEINAEGGVAVANGDSVADWNGAKRLIEQCVSEFGKIDTLVNNAGILHWAYFIDENEDEIDATVAVNLRGTMATARHALDHMIPRKQGSIVNVTSVGQIGFSTASIYGLTKAGVAGFTFTLAMELAEHNIRVNAISPQAHTRMSGPIVLGQRITGSGPEVPPDRVPPENLGPLAVFLASDQSSYVTGQVVHLGGKTLALHSHPQIHYPVAHSGEWTVQEIQEYFKETLGKNLEPVGQIAHGYGFYQGLGGSRSAKPPI